MLILSILCIILMVIIFALSKQNSTLRNEVIDLRWRVEAKERAHQHALFQSHHRNVEVLTQLLRAYVDWGHDAQALRTLELEHAQLQADHAFLWERAVAWDAKLTKEIEMLSSEPITYWPSTTTASYPAFRPEAWRLNATDDAVEVEFVSPFVD